MPRRSRLQVGSCIAASTIVEDPALSALIARECALLTPELELKWAAIEPQRGGHRFEALDRIAGFARRHRMRLHGHALLWHRSIPGWALASFRDAPDWRPVAAHFAAVIGRYRHEIESWDVINEPIDAGERPDGLRVSPLLTAFGPSYIARALMEARRLAPEAELRINEYGLEYELPEEAARRRHLLRLLESLIRAGVPLDAVGLQAHLDLGKGPIRQQTLDAFLDEIEALGLAIHVSELDVKEHDYVLPVEARDRRVADAVRAYLEVVLAHRGVRSVTTWGLSDRRSWLEIGADDFARYPSAWQDGTSPGLNRGLPFDAALQPKPMHRALRSSIARHGG